MSDSERKDKLTYAATGVDIQAGERAVDRIKALAADTFGSQVLAGIGAFGGVFRPDLGGFRSPVLVSSTDSVGTKVKVAVMTGRHDTVGEDLVNHCLNDILVQGARGLFFLDYIGIHTVEQPVVEALVCGLARACKANGIALLGGETAEMPDLYQPGEYDLAGFIVGIAEEERLVTGARIAPGDICLGLPASGLHTNGYTLARRVLFDIAGHRPDDHVEALKATVADVLLEVHRCYAGIVLPLLERFAVHGMAHVTGGGIPGNLRRVLPSGCRAVIRKGAWPVLPIFRYLQERGGIEESEMYRAFNMGIGYILVVAPEETEAVCAALADAGETVYRIGEIVTGRQDVILE